MVRPVAASVVVALTALRDRIMSPKRVDCEVSGRTSEARSSVAVCRMVRRGSVAV